MLRTTVNVQGKLIIFKPVSEYRGLSGPIQIEFPYACVLGEEQLFLEIIPEDVVHYYNSNVAEGAKLITPVLHVDRNNGAPFLVTVRVTLPLLKGVCDKPEDAKKRPDRIKVSQKDSTVEIKTTKFSPAAVTCHENVLDALGVNDEFNQKYKDLGIYLMIEQGPEAKFRFDLRKFESWRQHRDFRMDKSKFMCLLLNPQAVKKEDYGTKITISLCGRDEMEVCKRNPHIKGKKIIFIFPNPENDIDDSNVRTVIIRKVDKGTPKQLKFDIDYNSQNISNLSSTHEFQVEYLEKKYFDEKANETLPSQSMLTDFLYYLDEKWSTFLIRYMELKIDGLREFIEKDIITTLNIRTFTCTDETIGKLRKVLKFEKYNDFNFTANCPTSMIASIVKNFRGSTDLARAKRQLVKVLKLSGVVSDTEEFSYGLNMESREDLASALMYLPVDDLRKSIRKMYQEEHTKGLKNCSSVRNFLGIADDSVDLA